MARPASFLGTGHGERTRNKAATGASQTKDWRVSTAAEIARHAAASGAERCRPAERLDSLQRQEGEQQRQVVREQREGRAEEVGREHEHERERQRLPRLERRGPAEQPEQRQRGAVRDRRVQQPELPQLEARDLAEAGEQQVVQRRLCGRIGLRSTWSANCLIVGRW